MATINKLTRTDAVTDSDLLPIWQTANKDSRAITFQALAESTVAKVIELGGVSIPDLSNFQAAVEAVQAQLASVVPNLIPPGGDVGQVVVRSAFGPAWATLTAGSPIVPVTPPPPAPAPSPEAPDYASSTAAAGASSQNMRTKTAQLQS